MKSFKYKFAEDDKVSSRIRQGIVIVTLFGMTGAGIAAFLSML